MARKQSTHVRSAPPRAPRLLRAGVAALSAVSPRLAAAAVLPLFFKAPSRRPRRAEETAVLAQGARFAVGKGRDRLVAWRWGEGPLMLLVHGWGGCAGQMTPLVGAVVGAGFTAVAFDAPGHGQSPGWSASMPIFARAIERMAAELGSIHGVVAHSMGGPAFALAAARGQRVQRAVFIGPPADVATWVETFVDALGLSAPAVAALEARARRLTGERLERLNSTALGPHLTAPLLVIHDRDDREVPLADGERVAREAVSGQLVVTAGLGHRRILRDPAVAAEAVRFLRSASDGEPRAARRHSAEAELEPG